jgi:sterol desaturase/sphingolipid hydroxylase (fatty acid hydroxylase superfamily)
MALIEYSIHRFMMHKQFLFLPKKVFTEHAIEHHSKNRIDVNIDLNPLLHLVIGIPVFIVLGMLGWWTFLAALVTTFILHGLLWTKLHRGYHEVERGWIRFFPPYSFMKKHHLLHHKHPSKNYGAVYIFTDLIFGTYIGK